MSSAAQDNEDLAWHGRSSADPADVLRRWLAAHPVAVVGFLDQHGRPLPWPTDIPLGPGHEQSDRSLLDLVVAEDRNRLTGSFIDALDHGVAVTTIRLLANPDDVLALHYIDQRADLGGVVRLCWSGDDGDGGAEPRFAAAAEIHRPRVAAIEKGENGVITAVDGDFVRMLGWRPDEVVGHRSLSLIHPEDQSRAVDCWLRMIGGGGQHTVRLRHRSAAGRWVWLESCNDLRSPPGEPISVHTQLVDVSDEMRAVETLRHREELLRKITETVPVGIAHLGPDGHVAYANGALLRLLGAMSLESLDDLLAALADGDRDAVAREIRGVIESGSDAEVHLTVAPSGGGGEGRCRLSLSAVLDGSAVVGILLCAVDVTELAARATRDALTGCLNRASILTLLDGALAIPDRRVGVAFADLDGLKVVNDSLGHAAGDILLQHVAAGLTSAVGGEGHVGRLGGDEFLVVLPDLAGEEHLEEMGRHLHAELDRRGAATSIGLQLALAGSCDAAALVERADRAMYRIKQAASTTS